MREKERSLKITQQIHELRNLLSSGGVIVPKVSFTHKLDEFHVVMDVLSTQRFANLLYYVMYLSSENHRAPSPPS